jgi:hypothetical protein
MKNEIPFSKNVVPTAQAWKLIILWQKTLGYVTL